MNLNSNCFKHSLLPSEIARLVYAYCIETGCTKSAQHLLEESPYLKEFALGIKSGFSFSTTIDNQSLLQILNCQWHEHLFGSNNVSIPTENHYCKDDKITSDQYSTPKHKILYSMNSGNNYSPRRKNATPKRLTNSTPINHQQHCNQQQQQQRSHQLQPESQQSKQYGILSQYSCDNSQIFSSPLSSNESEVQIEVQPKIIFDELLKCGPLHDKVADHIQKLIRANQDDNANQLNSNIDNNDNEISEKSDLNAANEENNVSNKQGNIEKDSIPSLDEILESLTGEPVFHDFLGRVVEKEIANTPFKSLQTHNSCPFAGSNNLNTPYVPSPSDDLKNYDPKQLPVKNIMKEMEEQQQYQQQQNNQSADDTMMDCEFLRKISPTNQSNDIRQPKSSEPNENLKISNSHQRIVNSSPNLIRSRLFISNSDGRVSVPKFTKFSQNQQKVQQEFYIASPINVNNVTNNNATQTEPGKTLTTTIEVVPGDNKTKTSGLGSNVENVISQQQINTGIDVLSTPVSWPSNTITTQPIILPSNPLAWENNGIIYFTYPSNDTICYYDPHQLPSSTITTINATPSTSQNIQIRTNQQKESVASSTATASQQDDVDDEKIIANNVESKQQQQQPPKILRQIPSILSKAKQKNSSNTLDGQSKLLADDDNLVKDNRQIDNNSSLTKKCDDIYKLKKKLESYQLSRSEKPKKRKMDHEEMKKRKNSLDNSDEKIKTILSSDIEKFLGDIHKDENEK